MRGGASGSTISDQTTDRIWIEAADAAGSLFLIQELFGLFRAELVAREDDSLEILVRPGTDPARVLSGVLDVVQRWLDGGEECFASIRFGERTYTLGPSFGDRAPVRAGLEQETPGLR